MAYTSKNNQQIGASSSRDRNELLGTGGNLNGPSRSGLNNPSYLSSPAHAPTSGAPSELDQIHLQINKTTDESLDSTRRMVGMMEESHTVGAKTMENLYRQGEQLDKVEDNLDTMNQDMREAERNMEQMEKCCGLCVCPWRRRRNFEKMSGYQKTFGAKGGMTGGRAERENNEIHMEQPNVDAASYGNQKFITRITNDAREDEMDENLNAVGGMLGGLKSMATDMGREIDTQNQALNRMNDKAQVTDDRVTKANRRADNLLKKA